MDGARGAPESAALGGGRCLLLRHSSLGDADRAGTVGWSGVGCSAGLRGVLSPLPGSCSNSSRWRPATFVGLKCSAACSNAGGGAEGPTAFTARLYDGGRRAASRVGRRAGGPLPAPLLRTKCFPSHLALLCIMLCTGVAPGVRGIAGTTRGRGVQVAAVQSAEVGWQMRHLCHLHGWPMCWQRRPVLAINVSW